MQHSEAVKPYDPVVLAARFGGDISLIRRVVRVFLDDYPQQVDTLRRAVQGSDIDRLYSISHSIKGAVSQFGAPRAAAAALGVEICCRSGDRVAVPACVDALIVAMNELATALRAGYPIG